MSVAEIAVETLSASDLIERTLHRRAVEAVIWGMPAVNYDLMLQEMLTKTAGKQNQVIYWGRALDWHNQTLTPNPDTLYFMAFFDTREVGPIVLDIPPADAEGALNANIVNLWQQPLEDAGLLGVDKGKGIKLLILPPGYSDKIPDGYVALEPGTFGSYALLRSNLKSHSDADVAKSLSYGKRVKLYPLSRASAAQPTVFTDVQDVLFDSTIRYDESFFDGLNRIVQSEPWFERDRAMIDSLRTLGIEKGKPFAPNAQIKERWKPVSAMRSWSSRRNTTPACRRFSKARTGPFRRLPNSSRQRRRTLQSRITIRSMHAASPTTMPSSASSGSARASST